MTKVTFNDLFGQPTTGKQSFELIPELRNNGLICGANTETGVGAVFSEKNLQNATENGAAELDKDGVLTVDADRVWITGSMTMIRVADKSDNAGALLSTLVASQKKAK